MKRRLLFTLLSLAALAALVWLVLLPHEPVYQGKPLGFWLEQYGSNHWTHPNNDLDKQAQAAIRHIGTNAIPIYLQLMTGRESPFKLKLRAFLPKQWRTRLHMPDALASQNELYRRRVLGAFGIVALGPDAKPAVHALMRLLNEKDPNVRYNAVFALRSLGPVASEALPSLIKCLNDPDAAVRSDALLSMGEIHQDPERVIPVLIGCLEAKGQSGRYFALWSLRQFGAAAKPAVPAIVALLNDSDPSIRAEATKVLKAIDPDAALPKLINALKDSDANVRIAATDALADYGQAAKPAVPALVNLSKNDPDPSVRDEATNALKAIDPSATANAGIK